MPDFSKFLPTTSPKKRQQMAQAALKKYKNNDHNIRMFAISSFLSHSNGKVLKKYYDMSKNRDRTFRQGVALGIYLFLKNQWITNVDMKNGISIDDIVSWQSEEAVYIAKLDKMKRYISNSNKRKHFIEWMQRARQLDPSESKYLFEKAFIGNLSDGLDVMDKALKFNKKYQGGYLQEIYLLKMTKFSLEKNVSAEPYLQALNKINVPNSFLVDIGNIYIKLKKYKKALRIFERNFLARSRNLEPFNFIHEIHMKIVFLHKKLGNHKMANVFYNYMYEVFRRKKYFSADLTKKAFDAAKPK